MFSRFAKLLLILSAIAPVGLVYAWVAFREGHHAAALWLLLGCIALVGICATLLARAKALLERFSFSPLLGLLGWHFYKVSSTEGVSYVLVTKKQIRNTGQINNVGQLTDYILIDLGDGDAGKPTSHM